LVEWQEENLAFKNPVMPRGSPLEQMEEVNPRGTG